MGNLAKGRLPFETDLWKRPGEATNGNHTNYDGDNGWAGSADPAPYTLDLESVHGIQQIRILLYDGLGSKRTDFDSRKYNFALNLSQDGKKYSRVFETGKESEGNGWFVVSFSSKIEARFVQFLGISNSVGSSIHLVQIEVYDTPPNLFPQSINQQEFIVRDEFPNLKTQTPSVELSKQAQPKPSSKNDDFRETDKQFLDFQDTFTAVMESLVGIHDFAKHEYEISETFDLNGRISFFANGVLPEDFASIDYEVIYERNTAVTRVAVRDDGRLYSDFLSTIFQVGNEQGFLITGTTINGKSTSYATHPNKISLDQERAILVDSIQINIQELRTVFFNGLKEKAQELLSKPKPPNVPESQLQGFDIIYESVENHFKSKSSRLGKAEWSRGTYDMHGTISFYDTGHEMFNETSLAFQFGVTGDDFFVRIGCLTEDDSSPFFRQILATIKIPGDYKLVERTIPGLDISSLFIEYEDSVQRFSHTNDSDVVSLLIKSLTNMDELLYPLIKDAFDHDFTPDQQVEALKKLDRSWQDHFYTIYENEGTEILNGYTKIRTEFHVYESELSNGSVWLRHFFNRALKNHHYSVEPHPEVLENQDWKEEAEVGAVFPYVEGKVYDENITPLYRYYNAELFDSFYTITRNDKKYGGKGYQYEDIECLVFKTANSLTVPVDLWVRGDSLLPKSKAVLDEEFEVSKAEQKQLNEQEEDLIYDTERSLENTYAGILPDSIHGQKDDLDINGDVLAFARIMASKTILPPFAIALFGKWGSGKSFFMGQLQERVAQFSELGKDSPFCSGIAQVHFNAWSYLDANLWASIVTKIFEGLSDYIDGNARPGNFKDEIEEQLSRELHVSKDEIELLEKKKKAVEGRIKSLQIESEKKHEILDKTILKIGKNTLTSSIKKVNDEFDAKSRVVKALDSNGSFIKTQEELKQLVPEKYWSDPKELFNRLNSTRTFIREFISSKDWGFNVLFVAVVFGVVVLFPIVLQLCIAEIRNVDFTTVQIILSSFVGIGATLKRVESIYSGYQPLLASFWKIKEDHDFGIEKARQEYEQDQRATELKIEQHKAEIEQTSNEIQAFEDKKDDLEFRIKNVLATEALYSFIDKRSGSQDYKKHLGVVSIIRKDFEVLSSLFDKHKDEAKQDSFLKKFDRPLERIILYIDDLDRCPEDRVVEVLEAVNLLMAFPLFIVVVGVDPRWVKNALAKQHYTQFGSGLNKENTEGLSQLAPSDYLEKIFQVPFHLKEASNESVRNMIKSLTGYNQNSMELKDADNSSENKSNGQTAKLETQENQNKPEQVRQQENAKSDNIQPDGENQLDVDEPDFARAIVLTKGEISLMEDMAPIIGNNPRAVKRFVNVYQIVKAHEGLSIMIRQEAEEHTAIMFLLALSMGPHKELSTEFQRYTILESKQKLSLSKFLSSNGLKKLKSQLDTELSGNNTLASMKTSDISLFNKHVRFIQRFTFDEV
jgi:hypothetical protein